ncbi:MAG: hypothetical protein NTX56_16440 [Proteobacteria bacterium]|nr:hypothetical protein [Pseudomonadota bacterium]
MMAAKPMEPGFAIPLAGGREAEWVREDTGEHQGNQHFRTIDTLRLMLRNGTITTHMYDAGQDFFTAFAIAHLDGPSALDLNRVRGGQWQDSMTERVAFARKRVGQALDAVGGLCSPGGAAIWHIAGLQQTIKEWTAQEIWNGRSLSQPEARGILVAALGMLAMHYGYLRKPD